MRVVLKIWSLMLALLVTGMAVANTTAVPTPQQIDAFRKLPPAQQEVLARQYGIPLDKITGSPLVTAAAPQAQPASVGARETSAAALVTSPDDAVQSAAQTQFAKIQPFGYDLFAGSPSTFAPLDYAPVPASYLLGPGDSLRIQLLGKQSSQYELTVNRDGDIDFPELGPMLISGLTFDEAKAAIGEQISQRMIGVQAHVTMGKVRPLQVMVMGEAYKPGSYTVSALSTITHAIFAAGGVKPLASLRNVQLKRAGELVATLDLYDLLLAGDSSNDLMLKPGDVVLIPTIGNTVTVDGQVRRPAIYEFKAGETLADALRFAGGWLAGGYPAGVTLERFGQQQQRQVETLDLTAKASLATPLRDGDLLRVPVASSRFSSGVTLVGAVVRPGNHAFREGMRISNLLRTPTADLLTEADLSYTLVVRERNFSGEIDVYQTNLVDALQQPGSDADLALQPKDKVVVFSRFERKPVELSELDDLAGTSAELQQRRQQMLDVRKDDNRYWKSYLAEFFGLDAHASTFDSELQNKLSELNISASSLEKMVAEAADGDVKTMRDTRDFSRTRLLTPIIKALERQAGVGAPVQLVEISGAVKYPGIYPLPVNGHIADAITAAGGLMETAFLGNAELTRSNLDGGDRSQVTHMRFNVANAMNDSPADNLPLVSKDRLIIQTMPDFKTGNVVTLYGEVKFPGTYAFARGETLHDVIIRAGGFTEQAHVAAAVLTREAIRKQEAEYIERIGDDMRKELASMSLRSSSGAGQLVGYDQLQMLMSDLTRIKPVGRLVVDIPALMQGDETNNVRLEGGDKLYVPAFRNIISVVGQVQLPTTHLFQAGVSTEDYIRMSGGSKRQADDDRLYVIKANGAVRMPESGFWFSSNSDSTLEPGDTIVVPLDVNYRDNLTLWTNVTQILYNTGVAVAAIAAVL